MIGLLMFLWDSARDTSGICLGKAADNSDDAVSVLEGCDQGDLECKLVSKLSRRHKPDHLFPTKDAPPNHPVALQLHKAKMARPIQRYHLKQIIDARVCANIPPQTPR
jgi:hypothetical protein